MNANDTAIKIAQLMKLYAQIVVIDNNSIIAGECRTPDAPLCLYVRKCITQVRTIQTKTKELCSGQRKLTGNLNVAKINFYILFIHSATVSQSDGYFLIISFLYFSLRSRQTNKNSSPEQTKVIENEKAGVFARVKMKDNSHS